MNAEGTIQRIVATLADDDSDVRAAVVAALQAFSTQGSLFNPFSNICLIFLADLYQDNIKLSIPSMIKQLDNDSWEIRLQNIQVLLKLSENGLSLLTNGSYQLIFSV
jgi:hypothetical protein